LGFNWCHRSVVAGLDFLMWSLNIYRHPVENGVATSVGGDSIAHVGDLRYAIDYDAPEGTPVVAAANGVVLAVADDSSVGGVTRDFEELGNFIEILHSGGEISEYEHLRWKSACVSIGDVVRCGQLIGEVGNTGWSECPHLHFMVYGNDGRCETRKIRFDSPYEAAHDAAFDICLE
jgi:murein DD-endopeptidase MepM/ murein hydrolase activator NlpD